VDQRLEGVAAVAHAVNVLLSGIFHASVLFLVAAGLQVVFGVQKIFNLACGSFYALGAYVGVSVVGWYVGAGGPPALFIVPLALAGLAVGAVGVVVERGLLRFVYDRDETFQLLMTFAIVLMMEDAIRLTWGTAPRSTAGLYLTYGQVRVFGATVHPSPSDLTVAGRAILAADPDSPGSLGIAISEAVEIAAQDPTTRYSLGSVLNHVLMHQTVIGLEARKQLEKADDAADIVIGCAGGGSNFAGLAFPFLREKLAGNQDPTILAVEPSSCPTLTRGEYRYDFGDTAGLTPLMKMYTLGHDFVPSPIHAGGLRYHGMAPLVSHAVHEGLIEATALHQRECFEAALEFARTQGVVPAPESSHALAQARREALAAAETGAEPVIVVGLSGHGLLELGAYDAFLGGRLEDDPLSDEDLAAALAGVPAV